MAKKPEDLIPLNSNQTAILLQSQQMAIEVARRIAFFLYHPNQRNMELMDDACRLQKDFTSVFDENGYIKEEH